MLGKSDFRARARTARKTLSLAARATASQYAAGHAHALIQSRGFQNIALYHDIGSEMETKPLAQKLWDAGIATALPVTIPGTVLRFHVYDAETVLEPDAQNILAANGTPEITPDALILPLLAYDDAGNRLGQGGGYYDRTLAELRAANPRIWAIGLAFACQQVDKLPTEPHDQKLDAVVTEQGAIVFNKG